MLKNSERNLQLLNKGEPVFYNVSSVETGNARLTQSLAKRLGKRVHLKMPLRGLRKNSKGTFDLLFDRSRKSSADIVVLTMPTSVFKDIQFEAGIISSPVLTLMQSLSYGTITKILAPVEIKEDAFGSVTSDRGSTWFSKDRKIIRIFIMCLIVRRGDCF